MKRDPHAGNQGSRFNDSLAFLLEGCFSAISHDCDCPNCTMQKGRAVKALMYLCGDKLGVEEAKHMLVQHSPYEFMLGSVVHGQDEEFEPIPDVVIEVCRGALKSNLDTNDKAIIAGWLESVGA